MTMRRQSLRPRQIDIHARMRIIRSQEDLEVEDDATGTQPSTTFEELVAHLDDPQQQQHQPTATTAASSSSSAAAHQQKAKRKKNIPIPVTLDVPSYEDEVKPDFIVPTSYLRFQNVPSPNDDLKIELDMEIAEIKWLKYHPKYGDNGDPRYQLPLDKFAQMLNALEKASAMINPNILTQAEAEEVFAKQLGMVKTPLYKVTVDVYNYWAAKRQAMKRPLLRKYWPQTPLNDTNPHLVFRPREKERYKLRKHRKNDMDGYRKLVQLKNDFERVRHLLEMVKKREQLKRMEIQFLDEMQTQAIYELTDVSGLKRKPVLPVEDDEDGLGDKQKKRKKKKKKGALHQDDGEGIGGGGDGGIQADSLGAQPATASGATTGTGGLSAAAGGSGGMATTGGSPSSIENFRMPTFMDYDTSSNYKVRDDHDPDLTQPYYPSYPMPSSHLMATIFSQPPKYRCRGRIGRGGRLVVDRIPVPSARYYGPKEVQATAREFSKQTAAATTAAATAVSAAATAPVGEAINSGHHAAILIQETSFRPLADKIENVTSARLNEIYAMSDSEDELIEPLTSSVYEGTTSRKSSSSSGSHSSGKSSTSQPPRAVKSTLTV